MKSPKIDHIEESRKLTQPLRDEDKRWQGKQKENQVAMAKAQADLEQIRAQSGSKKTEGFFARWKRWLKLKQ
jgi:hypothetical protein